MGPERLQTGRTHSEGPIYVYASHSHLCHQYNSRTRCPDVPVSDIQETQKNGFDIYCKRGLKDQSESRSLDFTRCGFIVRHQVKVGLSLNPFQQFHVVDNDSCAKSTIDIDTFFRYNWLCDVTLCEVLLNATIPLRALLYYIQRVSESILFFKFYLLSYAQRFNVTTYFNPQQISRITSFCSPTVELIIPRLPNGKYYFVSNVAIDSLASKNMSNLFVKRESCSINVISSVTFHTCLTKIFALHWCLWTPVKLLVNVSFRRNTNLCDNENCLNKVMYIV